MQQLSMDDANAAAQEARSGNLRENGAGVPDDQRPDYQAHDIPVITGHPECLIGFDRIVDVSPFNTDDDFLSKRQNLEYAGPQNYGNQVVVTVENPQVIDGQVWSEEHEFRDLRVLGDPSTDYSPYSLDTDVIGDPTDPDGVEINGVNLGMGGFEGEEIEDGFDAEYVQFFISARRASTVLGTLDTAGNGSHTQDGEFVEGIIEYPPAMGEDGYDPENDGAPRAIGYPELRADMVDQQGAIAFRFADDEPTTQSRVLVDFYRIIEGEDGAELEGLSPLAPEDEAYALPTYPRGGNVYWDHGSEATEQPEDVGVDAEPSTSGGMADAQSVMETETEELTYEDLGDEGQAFVDWALAAMEQMDDEYESVTEVDDWDEQHAKRTAGEPINATKEDLETIIDSRI